MAKIVIKFVNAVKKAIPEDQFEKLCGMARDGKMKFGRTCSDWGPKDFSGG